MRIASDGLVAAIVERFADGKWHDLTEAVLACGRLIPPQLAVRAADRQRPPSGLDGGYLARAAHGQRLVIQRVISGLAGAESDGAPGARGRWDRFRLPTGVMGADYGIGRGERNAGAKLTAERVREARARHAAGESYVALAREYGVHKATVRAAVIGLRWGSVT